MKEAYIVDAIRTPIGSFCGSLSDVRVDDLLALVIKELLNRNKTINPAEVDDVIIGCANQAGEDNRNVARMALLLAGMPFTVPGETVNRLCSSGMAAVINASRAIKLGDGNLYIAGGVENMTRGPYVISKSSSAYGRDSKMYDSSFGWRFINPEMHKLYGTEGMGETAENLAELFKINREDQDKFAYASQFKSAKAQKNGRFNEEITTVKIPQKKGTIIVDKDEFIKPDTTIEILSKLKPAFKKEGTVTAGNSSGLNDGAAVLLIASGDAVKKYNLNPLSKIVCSAVAGVEPRIMGIGPVEAVKKIFNKTGLTMNDIGIVELNEAFASQCLTCTRELGLKDDDNRINPNGGAIALGHPLGMSGARLLQTASIELHKQKTKFALVAMCVGVGQGYAVLLEKC